MCETAAFHDSKPTPVEIVKLTGWFLLFWHSFVLIRLSVSSLQLFICIPIVRTELGKVEEYYSNFWFALF